MGGLIVRQYLSSTYASGAAVPTQLRRGVFLATPHFGSFLAALVTSGLLGSGSILGNDAQTQEMSPGSQFLLSLATWNGGLDDLHGLDAIAVAGDAGDGFETGIANFDDGVVSLTSASLGFVRPGLTRVVSACHISNVELNILCPQTAPAIATITDASSPVAQIITAFLTGTTAWQSIGMAIESLSTTVSTGGLLLAFQDKNGGALTASSGTAAAAGSGTVKLTAGAAGFFDESLPAKTNLSITAAVGNAHDGLTLNLAPATSTAVVSKPGPLVHGVVPAGSAVFPYDSASGAYIAIYGSGFATSNSTASLPYPQNLGGVTVTVNGQAAALQYVGANQINMIFPTLPAGSAQLVVTNATGSDTTTVVIAPAVPTIFSLDGTGTGPAAAENALTGAIVSASAPLKAGSDYVALFLTGLGPTTTESDGLQHAQATVTLTVGGQNCTVLYAGRVPGVPGLDQVNCQIPAGISGAAVPVFITAAGRASNTVTLDIQ